MEPFLFNDSSCPRTTYERDPVHLNSSSRAVKYINNVKATWAALLPCSTSDFPFSTNPARVYNGMS